MDDTERNEDWLKTLAWDLGGWDDLLAHLGVMYAQPGEQRAAVSDFMTLPAWTAAPEAIKQAAASLGASAA